MQDLTSLAMQSPAALRRSARTDPSTSSAFNSIDDGHVLENIAPPHQDVNEPGLHVTHLDANPTITRRWNRRASANISTLEPEPEMQDIIDDFLSQWQPKNLQNDCLSQCGNRIYAAGDLNMIGCSKASGSSLAGSLDPGEHDVDADTSCTDRPGSSTVDTGECIGVGSFCEQGTGDDRSSPYTNHTYDAGNQSEAGFGLPSGLAIAGSHFPDCSGFPTGSSSIDAERDSATIANWVRGKASGSLTNQGAERLDKRHSSMRVGETDIGAIMPNSDQDGETDIGAIIPNSDQDGNTVIGAILHDISECPATCDALDFPSESGDDVVNTFVPNPSRATLRNRRRRRNQRNTRSQAVNATGQQLSLREAYMTRSTAASSSSEAYGEFGVSAIDCNLCGLPADEKCETCFCGKFLFGAEWWDLHGTQTTIAIPACRRLFAVRNIVFQACTTDNPDLVSSGKGNGTLRSWFRTLYRDLYYEASPTERPPMLQCDLDNVANAKLCQLLKAKNEIETLIVCK